MKSLMSVEQLDNVKAELQQVRRQSLAASRQNDFRTVARLTAEAARLNRAIHTQEDFAELSPKSLALIDALSDLDDAGHFVFPDDRPLVRQPALELSACEEAA